VIVEPVCGNGVIEGEEVCDGGENAVEGCTSECQVDCSDYDDDALESEDHHCYAGYDEDNFEGARADCAERGGYLVTISSVEENELVTDLVNNSKWIGAFEDLEPTEESEGVYEWVNGEPFEYANWEEGQPDGDSYRCNRFDFCFEHCVVLTGDGEWEDENCAIIDGYVCEWDPPGSQ
jgi:hypothetical protein